MLISAEKLTESAVSALLAAPWKERLSQGLVSKTSSGLPIFINNKDSVINIDSLTERAAPLAKKSHDGIRQFVSHLCSTSYDKSERFANNILEELKSKGRPVVGLVVGGGTIGPGVSRFVSDSTVQLFSFDVYESNHLSFIADAHWIPLESASCDFVWIQAVLEHVASPNLVAQECQRVLKPGGIIYAETPFMQQIHAGRYDFTRFTPLGHRMLFPNCDTLAAGSLDGPAVSMIWSLRYFFAGLFRSKNAGRVAGVLFSWLKLFDKIIPENYRQMGACSVFYLGRLRLGSSLSPAEMLTEYAGV